MRPGPWHPGHFSSRSALRAGARRRLSGTAAADDLPQEVDHDPADAGRQRDGAHAHTVDPQPGEHHAQRDVARRTDKRDRHAAEPVKISGKRVARKAENIKQRNKLHIFPAAFKGRAAVCAQHEADRRAGRQIHHQSGQQTHRQHQYETAAECFLHALRLAGTEILRHEHRCRRRAAVAERIGKAFDAGRGRIGRDHVRAAGIDRPLHEELADVKARLVQTGDKAVARRAAQQRRVHAAVAAGKQQLRRDPAQVEHADHGRNGLRGHCRPRGTGNAPAKVRDEQHIQPDIRRHGDRQRHERRRRAADGAQQRTVEIIDKRRRQTDKNDGEIRRHIARELLRRLDDAQQQRQAQKSDGTARERAQQPEHQRQKVLAPERLQIVCAKQLRKDHGHTGACAGDHEQKQIHHRPRNADSRKLQPARTTAENERIDRIVQLLKNVAEDQRRGQTQHMLRYAAGRQVMGPGLHPQFLPKMS